MTIELPKRIAENIDRFTGRTWLLPEVLSWWEDRPHERLFLLTGGPGTGKSMILAWLAGFGPEPEDALEQEQLARLREVVKAAHFCQAASRNVAPKAFAESIANQLTGTVQGFGEALAATLADRVQIVGSAQAGTAKTGSSLTGVAIGHIDLATLGDELSFDRAFSDPLKKLYNDSKDEPLILLVDALDETLGYTGDKGLPELLSTLTDLPEQVRIVVTTRNDPRVLKYYRSIAPFDLIKKAPPNIDDVGVYAAQRLAGRIELGDAQRGEFARRIAKQAKGVFLYAALVLDELLLQLPKIPDLTKYSLPDGLSGLYHDFLTRELGKEERLWFDIYEPLLGLIAVAQGEGLNTQQLTHITGRDIRAALRASKQYLVGDLPDGPFKPFHKSFADFLLEEKDNVDYHIDAGSMHDRVSQFFFTTYRDDWLRCDDEYALKYLPMHVMLRMHYEGHAERAAEDLGCLFTDLRFLEKKTGKLGVFSVLADLAAACLGLGRDNPRSREITEIHMVLDNESHNLLRWCTEDQPGYFMQQVLYRAVRLGFTGVVSKVTQIFHQRGTPYLNERWGSGQSSHALLRTLTGHLGKVWSIQVSADGARVLSGGNDGTVRVWRFDTGEEERILLGHTGRVRAVVVTRDGRQVVSAGADRTVRLWHLDTGQQVRVFDGHIYEVLSLALVPGNHKIVSGDAKGFIRIWDLLNGTYREFRAHSGEVRSLVVIEDGRCLISASSDRRIRIWNIEGGELLETLEGDRATFRAVVVSPDQRWVYAAASDGTVKVWDLDAPLHAGVREVAERYEGHRGRVRCVTLTEDGRYLISGAEDRLLKIWDTASRPVVKTAGALQGHSGTVWAVASVPGSASIVSASEDGAIKIWDLSSILNLHRISSKREDGWQGHSSRVRAIAASMDGQQVISGAQDGTIRYWRVPAKVQQEAGQRITVNDLPGHAVEVTDLIIQPGSRLALSASRDRTIKIWDLTDGTELGVLKGHRGRVTRILPGPYEKSVLSASEDGTLIFWNTKDTTGVVFRGHRAPVLAAALNPHTKRVISGSSDGAVILWSVFPFRSTGPCEQTPLAMSQEHSKAVLDIAITSDGRLAVSASSDGLLKVWPLAPPGAGDPGQSPWRAICTLEGHEGPVLRVVITPDGKRAVSVSSDDSIRVWDLPENGALVQDAETRICSLVKRVRRPIGVAITEDSKKAITISAKGRLDIWGIEGAADVAQAGMCNIASVSLAHELTCIAVVSQGKRIIIGDRAGDIACYDFFEVTNSHGDSQR